MSERVTLRPANGDNGPVTSAPTDGQGRAVPSSVSCRGCTAADGSPIRVLLVDDERALTNLIRMALQYEGWEIDVAHDAAEAVAKYRAATPDLLVLDIMLPDTDGLGVLAQIRDSGHLHPDAVPHRPGFGGRPGQRADRGRRRLHDQTVLAGRTRRAAARVAAAHRLSDTWPRTNR